MKVLVLCLSILLAGSVRADEADDAMKADFAKLSGINSSISFLAKDNLSCTTNAQCVNVPYGSKACGGPRGYVLASKKNKSFAAIQKLAKYSATTEDNINITYGIFSTCDVQMPNPTACVEKVCQ